MQAHLPRQEQPRPAATAAATAAVSLATSCHASNNYLVVPWLCELRNLHDLNYSKNKPRTDCRVVRNIDFV